MVLKTTNSDEVKSCKCKQQSNEFSDSNHHTCGYNLNHHNANTALEKVSIQDREVNPFFKKVM
jgi:hypothetical protein